MTTVNPAHNDVYLRFRTALHRIHRLPDTPAKHELSAALDRALNEAANPTEQLARIAAVTKRLDGLQPQEVKS